MAQEPFAGMQLRGSLERLRSPAEEFERVRARPSAATPPSGTPAVAAPPVAPASSVVSTPATAPAARPFGETAQIGPGTRAKRARARRSRSPTAEPVHQSTLVPTIARGVSPDVQPLVVGLPDPTLIPVVVRRRRLVETDPYGPVGVRLGSTFLFFPAIEQSFGYDDNPNRTSGPARRGSTVSRTDAELRVQSNWSRHALTGFVRGGYSLFPDVPSADRPDAEGRLDLRIDVTRDTQIDAETHFRIDTERPGDPNSVAGVAERPINSLVGGSTGVTHRFNRLAVGLRGTLDREDFEDARLGDGTVVSQQDRNVTQVGVRLRAAYEFNPGLIPFVEGIVDTRVHDSRIDRRGFARDSDGVAIRAGSTFEITRTLTGEVSGGIQARLYDDSRLETLVGPLVEAGLIWSASPLTNVRLRGQSTIEETTIPFSSGAITQRATLEVQHDFRRNLSVTAALTASNTDYDGVRLREDGFSGTLRVDYRMTRSVALRASFTHERLKSTSPGADYTANVFLVGMRFQR